MSKYVITQPKPNYSYLAWISIMLLSFNVYHPMLLKIFDLHNQVIIFLTHGIAIVLLLLYLTAEKKLSLFAIRFGAIEYLLLLSLAVVIITSKDIAGNMTFIVLYAVYGFVIILMKYDKKLMHIAFWCLLFTGLLHVIFSCWFYFDNDFYFANIFPHFNTRQKEHLYYQVIHNKFATGMANFFSQNGIYISVALCCTYTLLYGRKHSKTRLLLLALFLINVIVLFMTGKRGVAIFASFAMIATYMVCGKQKAGNRLLVAIFIMITAILLLYVFSFYNEGIAATLSRFFEMADGSENQDISTGRFDLYRWSWAFFLDNPILGIGWREYTNEVAVYFRGSNNLIDTHNVFLQLLCETGVVGCSVFLGLFATALLKTVGYAIAGNRERTNMQESDRKNAGVFLVLSNILLGLLYYRKSFVRF